jgi:hypothetical protein
LDVPLLSLRRALLVSAVQSVRQLIGPDLQRVGVDAASAITSAADCSAASS